MLFLYWISIWPGGLGTFFLGLWWSSREGSGENGSRTRYRLTRRERATGLTVHTTVLWDAGHLNCPLLLSCPLVPSVSLADVLTLQRWSCTVVGLGDLRCLPKPQRSWLYRNCCVAARATLGPRKLCGAWMPTWTIGTSQPLVLPSSQALTKKET